MTNRTIFVDRPHHMSLRDTEAPVLQAGEALLRIRRVGVCGTDIHAFHGNQPFLEYPRILGHELAAEVIELAEPHPQIQPGDHVAVVPYLPCGHCIACRRDRPNCCTSLRVLGVHTDGGMREWLTVPASCLVPAGDLDLDRLALVECLSVGFHGVRRAELQADETVLVLGTGPIGMGITQAARARGARVLVADVREDRLAFCREHLKVDQTFLVDDTLAARLEEATQGDYPTAVFDATGNVESMCKAVHYCAHGARLIYVGLVAAEILFHHPDFHKRELSLHSSRNATREDFADVVRGMSDGSVQASCTITHRSSVDRFVEDFAQWATPGSGVLKGVLEL